MPIEFHCPGCKKQLRVPDSAAGKKAKCPSCEMVCAIPSAGTQQPPVAPVMTSSPTARQSDHLKETNYFPAGGPAASSAPGVSSVADPHSPVPNPFASPTQHAQSTPQSFPTTNFELATRSSRLLGRILDGVFSALCGFAFAVLLAIIGGVVGQDEDVAAIGGSIGFYLGIFVFAIVNWTLIVKSGQTLGKKVMRTRIVMEETGQLPGFVQGVLLRSIVFGLLCNLPIIGFPILLLVNAIWIFGDNRQCLHDLLAKTRVVVA